MDSTDETLERMQARHRKEQRELQGRITNKKKNATKKTRKFVNDECASLEHELKERQEEERRRLEGGSGETDGADDQNHPPTAVDDLASALDSTNLDSRSQSQQQPPQPPTRTPEQQQQQQQQQQPPKQKRNRQKERLARRAAEQQAAAQAAEAEAAGMTDHRAVEREAMQREFAARALREHEIAPDGHCLFSAVADQLRVNGIALERRGGLADDGGLRPRVEVQVQVREQGQEREQEQGHGEAQGQEQGEGGGGAPGYRVVRRAAAEWIATHRDEYEGFMVDEPGGVEGYVSKIRDTAEWGGQLELSALANAYGVEIRVVQGGRVEVVKPSVAGDGVKEGEGKTLWLAYYRHGYGLGEHYNSLRKAG